MTITLPTYTDFTAIEFVATSEDELPQALECVTNPMAYHRRNAEKWRKKGVEVREVVIKIGDEEEVLTFDEFEERYVR